MGYLDAYIDEAVEVPTDWSVEAIVVRELERLSMMAYVAERAAGRPRRLGGDATYAELAQDKKRTRAILHAAKTSRNAWLTETEGKAWRVPAPNAELRDRLNKMAATVNWPDFVEDREHDLVRRASLVATWAVRYSERRFGNRALSRFLSEQERMRWAVSK